jgi:hypothetical protein
VPPDVTTGLDTGATNAIDDADTQARMWSKSNVDPFLAQLSAVPELAAFTRTPLLLALLALSWRGEPLPPRRFDLYQVIVTMLVETHPRMRARASRAGTRPLTSAEFLTLIEAVAYRLKANETPQPVPQKAMQKLIAETLADEDILGLEAGEARQMAAAAMTMAEDEFGLVVPQGAGYVGFVHRVILDHLAGRHLAQVDPTEQLDTFSDKHRDPAWTDVLLAALNAQTSTHTVAELLDAVIATAADLKAAGVVWPDTVLRHEAAWRFIGEALAADVKLALRKAVELIERLTTEVDTSAALSYRADLIATLVQASVIPANWRRLVRTFRRWLDSTRAFPAAAMWALREFPSPDDQVRTVLLHGMRHRDGGVRSSAVDAFRQRFGNVVPKSNSQQDDAHAGGDHTETEKSVRPIEPALLDLIRTGPGTEAQATALMALALGWPNEDVTREHLGWARRQPKTNLRSVALYCIGQANPEPRLRELFDATEIEWVMAYLHGEPLLSDHDWTGLNSALAVRVVAEAEEAEKQKIAEFVLETLRENGARGGNRCLSWQLACESLAGFDSLRDWVVSELSKSDEERPLILYNLAQMPARWLEHQPMMDAVLSRIDSQLADSWTGAVNLTRLLTPDDALDALLRALDNFRPAGAARELVNQFKDDPKVVQELTRRFADDKQTGRLAYVALDFLGADEGFDRIYTVLRNANEAGGGPGGEERVVLAGAVAAEWRELTETAVREAAVPATDDKPYPIDPTTAAAVIAKYRDEDVCAACVEVPTNGLGWHIPHVIYTWPGRTVDYTLTELKSNRHVTEGISDNTHSLTLRAHTERPGDRSDEVLYLAVALMRPLPAELREVLAHELCLAPIRPPDLLDVCGQWLNDPDDGVRRTTAVGITQALLRPHRMHGREGDTGSTNDRGTSAELDAWRDVVRSQLRAYGRTHDEDRQNAWISMLLLGEPELIDGLKETIGEPTEPGIRLTDIHGNPDTLLIELIGQNWFALADHFGNPPINRLTGARQELNSDPIRVVRALAAGAGASPPLAELVRAQLAAEQDHAAEETQGTTKQVQGSQLSDAPAVIDFLIGEEGRTLANLNRVLDASDPDASAGGAPEATGKASAGNGHSPDSSRPGASPPKNSTRRSPKRAASMLVTSHRDGRCPAAQSHGQRTPCCSHVTNPPSSA